MRCRKAGRPKQAPAASGAEGGEGVADSGPQCADAPLGGAPTAPRPLPLPEEGSDPLRQPPEPRDQAAGRPQGTRGGSPGAVTADAPRAPTRAAGIGDRQPPRPPFPSRGLRLPPSGEHRPGGGRCPPGPAAVPGATGSRPSRPSAASRPRWWCCGRPPRRRSTWTWTSSRCTAAPRAATSATRWTSTYLPLARKFPRARGPTPPQDGSLPLCRGTRACPRSLMAGDRESPSRCPLGVPSGSPPPASSLAFHARCAL